MNSTLCALSLHCAFLRILHLSNLCNKQTSTSKTMCLKWKYVEMAGQRIDAHIWEEHEICHYSENESKEKIVIINRANIIQTFAWLLCLPANFFLVAPGLDTRIDERKLCHKDYHWQVL